MRKISLTCEIWNLFPQAPIRKFFWCYYKHWLNTSMADEKYKKNAICFTITVHWKLKLLNSWWIPSLYRLNFQQLFVYTVFLRRHRPCTDHREDSIPSVLPNCSDRNRVQWTLFTIYSTFWMEGWDWFDLQRIPVLFPGEIDILYSRVCWIWLFLLWMGFIFFLCLCFFF